MHICTYICMDSSYRFAPKYSVISDRKKYIDAWKLEQGISWYNLSYSIAVNMVTGLSGCSGRKIGKNNSKLVKFLGAV